MRLVPLERPAANEFIAQHHRHSKPVHGDKFRVGLERAGDLIGVGMAGRPKARALDDGHTIEVVRVCLAVGAENACSMLYGALCRAAKALGYSRVVTYTLATEGGGSLRASNFEPIATVAGRQWDTPSRRREARVAPDRTRWERRL